jgi:hypothetical protein
MQRLDLHKLALRLKVIEMLRHHTQQLRLRTAAQIWRQKVLPN